MRASGASLNEKKKLLAKWQALGGEETHTAILWDWCIVIAAYR